MQYLYRDQYKLERHSIPEDQVAHFEAEAAERYLTRIALKPSEVHYPDLPITNFQSDIAEALAEHQVVVITGDTGSGKTTQLPKICLEQGLADAGEIVLTQPRRIAARSVASRLAEELNESLGSSVGYQTRFEKSLGEQTFIKVVTDGILLNEIHHQRLLKNYTCVIIDEAHERSLNIDFLLGYLKKILPKRPDLKVIITSATIATARFTDFFPQAKLIEVPGRQYPVDIVYQPLVDEHAMESEGIDMAASERSLAEGVADACESAWKTSRGEGDVLVFLPGEADIKDVAKHLSKQNWRNTEILPLFGRLSSQDQRRIFHPGDQRRVVLATNIAETSLTVPRIRFVVDSGLARIARYSTQTKIQRLPIEPIAQSSARQRAGRCGRLMPGICYRLYSESDFHSRPEFEAPEILRTNLASVLLQMMRLKIGDVRAFDFITPPEPKAVNDGYKTLEMLGAIETTSTNNQSNTAQTPDKPRSSKSRRSSQLRLTPIGRQIAQMPIEPKFARILIEADRLGVLYPALVIVAALSVQNIAITPNDKRTQAQQAHAAYRDANSDFLFYWNVWCDLIEYKKAHSNQQFKRYIESQYLRFLGVREWLETVGQLSRMLKGMKLKSATETLTSDKQNLTREIDYTALHTAMIAGFLDQVATKHEARWYIGPRGQKLMIFPGSKLAKLSPPWIVSALWLETKKIFAHEVAKISPEWIANAAPHLIKLQYGEPYWQKRTGRVVCKARQQFFGLTIAADIVVNYNQVDAERARDVFIQQGLVARAFRTKAKCIRRNEALIDQLIELEAQQRKVDLRITDEELAALYDQQLPSQVVDGKSFDRWYDKARRQNPEVLCFTESMLRQSSEPDEPLPQSISTPMADLELSYRFNPGAQDDGVTAHVPLAILNQLMPMPFTWLIPNWLEERIAALIKTLPKPIRKQLVPAPNYARAARERLSETNRQEVALDTALAEVFSQMTRQSITSDLFDESRIADELRMRFVIQDANQQPLASGRDLHALQQRFQDKAQAAFADLTKSNQAESPQKTLPNSAQTHPASQEKSATPILPKFGDKPLPETYALHYAGQTVTVYLAIKSTEKGARTIYCETADAAQRAMRSGLADLIEQRCRDKYRYIQQKIPDVQQIKLLLIGTTDEKAFMEDFLYRVTTDCFLTSTKNKALPRSSTALDLIIRQNQSELISLATELASILLAAVKQWREVRQQIDKIPQAAAKQWSASLEDIQDQLSSMVFPHFISCVPMRQLKSYQRYFKAIRYRLDKLHAGDVQRDIDLLQSYKSISRAIQKRIAEHWAHHGYVDDSLWQCQTMEQELRVSLFAQQLGTQMPISLKRIEREWERIESLTRIPGVSV